MAGKKWEGFANNLGNDQIEWEANGMGRREAIAIPHASWDMSGKK